jgi:sulfur-oxidizing protein SoxX
MLSASPTFRGAAAALALGLSITPAVAEMPDLELNGNIEAGKEVAMTRAKGNCVACHLMPGADSPGAIGPALIAIQTRYSSKADLAQQIWDPTVKNPTVVMPPFGKHGILSDQEFVDVVEYVWSL